MKTLHPWCFNIVNYFFLYNKDFLMFNESNFTFIFFTKIIKTLIIWILTH